MLANYLKKEEINQITVLLDEMDGCNLQEIHHIQSEINEIIARARARRERQEVERVEVIVKDNSITIPVAFLDYLNVRDGDVVHLRRNVARERCILVTKDTLGNKEEKEKENYLTVDEQPPGNLLADLKSNLKEFKERHLSESKKQRERLQDIKSRIEKLK